MREKAEEVLGKVLVWALVSVTLLVTPLWTLDPINPIKMLAVSTLAFVGLGLLLVNRQVLELGRYKVPLILIICFMVWQLVVVFGSGAPMVQQLFGSYGRNTGLITYLAFSILFVVSMAGATPSFLYRLLFASLVVGVASLSYGLVQIFGRDPIDWVNQYSPVFGFLGNPNFQSSLLGILGSVVFTQLLSGAVKLQVKVGYLVYLVVTLYVIKETDSQQGFLVLIIGSGIALGIFINQRNKTLGYSYLGLALIGFIAVLVGILNKGPLASLLYKDSVTYRGDYWRAGWKMTVDNPIFGVGIDSYGDWYRRSRTIEATLRRGPDVISNAAHNVFLDISAYGGFPLMLIYFALVVLVMISGVKVIKRSQGFNAGFVGLVAGWVAFQVQSIISINQIGLALWGWVLSGLIIGYEINTRSEVSAAEKKAGKSSTRDVKTSAATPVAISVGLILGVLIGIPPYLNSAQHRGALESGDPIAIERIAYMWPVDPMRMIQSALLFNENKLEAQGLKIALDATEIFRDYYSVWAALYSMKSASAEQKAEALLQMKRLDPLNPDLK